MVTRQRATYVIICGIVIFLLFGSSCTRESSPSSPSVTTGMGNPAPSGLRGTLIGTISQQPIAGATIAASAYSATTDALGNFQLDEMPDEGFLVTISGEHIYPRVVYIPFPIPPIIQLDAIEKDSGFHLGFYRELARGNYPTEQKMFPIHRWTAPEAPTFYIDINASAIYDKKVTSQTLTLTHDVIMEVLPVFSGGTYSTTTVHIQEFSRYSFDELPGNSIVITYDDTLYAQGGIGLTLTEPEILSNRGCSIDKAWIFLINDEALYAVSGFSRKTLLAHELGHAFGYRHTSLLPSIMKKHGAYRGVFSEADRLHMAVMYARPAGNKDIDRDPVSPGNMLAEKMGNYRVFFERRPNVFLSPMPAILSSGHYQRLLEETLRDFDNILRLD